MYFINKIKSLNYFKTISKNSIIAISLLSVFIVIVVLCIVFGDSKSNLLKTEGNFINSERTERKLAELHSAITGTNAHSILSLQDLGLIISLLDKSDETLVTKFNYEKQLAVLSFSKSVRFAKIKRFFNFSCLFALNSKIELLSCYNNDFELNWLIVKSFLFLFYGADISKTIDAFVSMNTLHEEYVILPSNTDKSVIKNYVDEDRKKIQSKTAVDLRPKSPEVAVFQTKADGSLASQTKSEEVKVFQPKSEKDFAFKPKSEKELFDLPLVGIDKFKYRGGFRISSKKFGGDVGSSVDFSLGQFTYNPQNKSIFIIGHPKDSAVAEFKVPAIVNSTQITDFKIADQLVQPFTKFYNSGRVDTGIENYFRVTGMELINGGLMINYINWYDANGTETDTSVYFKDAAHLASSEINGPYQLTGAAHSAGWLSAIPEEWQAILGGTHISGSQTGAAISSRLSVGPSAFAIRPIDVFSKQTSGHFDARKLLDFPLSNMLYDKSIYSEFVRKGEILRNFDGKNDLWTNMSGAAYGFILPGTSTYVTVGRSAGHESGLGYKIVQDDGTHCGGPCPRSANDYASYYWLWDVKELVKVKLGLQNSFDVRPYAYGEFSIPMDLKKAGVNSGYFDPASKLLYLSIPSGDETSVYERPPLMLVYEFTGLQLLGKFK